MNNFGRLCILIFTSKNNICVFLKKMMWLSMQPCLQVGLMQGILLGRYSWYHETNVESFLLLDVLKTVILLYQYYFHEHSAPFQVDYHTIIEIHSHSSAHLPKYSPDSRSRVFCHYFPNIPLSGSIEASSTIEGSKLGPFTRYLSLTLSSPSMSTL